MSDGYQLRGYIVSPLSTRAIRDIALYVRGQFCFTKEPIDLGLFLEQLSGYGITIDVVDDKDMPGFSFHSEACCIPETRTIYLTEETYYKACVNDQRTRFTIFHELGHLILGHSKELHRANLQSQVKPYQDSEWQADQFSAEVTMPIDIIYELELYSANAIKVQFGVSDAAAKRRYEQLVKNNLIKN